MLSYWDNGTNVLSTKRLTFLVFFFIIPYRLRALKIFIFVFVISYKNKKNELKGFLQRILKDFMKKKILGTSEAWSSSCLSHWPNKPANYIVD